MPSTSNFMHIVGDGAVTIGDSMPVWTKTFNTPNRDSSLSGFVIMNIKGLVSATTEIDVRINNVSVGKIVPYTYPIAEQGSPGAHWYTQMIALEGTQLNNGSNEIKIQAVGFPEATMANQYDDFYLKNVICFYHVNVP
jgi:hypothetical protein